MAGIVDCPFRIVDWGGVSPTWRGAASPLPDFYIGAHAAVSGMVLVTRDATRYRRYFPALEIIALDI